MVYIMKPQLAERVQYGKISIRMNATETPIIAPPKLIDSFVKGFNTVANNIQLILLPVLLDLLLWLGPRLGFKKLFDAQVAVWGDLAHQLFTPETYAQWQPLQKTLLEESARLNIFSALSTLPVGIPSLSASLAPLESALGTPTIVEVTTPGALVAYTILLVLLGFAAGALYFNWISRLAVPEPITFSMKSLVYQYLQTLLMTLIMVGLLLAMTIPAGFLLSVLALLSPAIMQMAGMMILFGILWVLLPMIFAPFGVFASQQKAIHAIITSMNLVRRYLPTAGLFVLIAMVLGMGLDQLWRVPPENSWLMLVGIAGHAFIYTALIASAFVYYRGGIHYMLQVQKIQSQLANKSTTA